MKRRLLSVLLSLALVLSIFPYGTASAEEKDLGGIWWDDNGTPDYADDDTYYVVVDTENIPVLPHEGGCFTDPGPDEELYTEDDGEHYCKVGDEYATVAHKLGVSHSGHVEVTFQKNAGGGTPAVMAIWREPVIPSHSKPVPLLMIGL